MIKYGRRKWEDEAALRVDLNAFDTATLRNRYSQILGVYTDLIPGYAKWTNKTKKATLVNAYATYILEHATIVKKPETFEELQAAVIEATMTYQGCYSGKKDWLESVGLEAPPAPIAGSVTLTIDPDLLAEGESATNDETITKLLNAVVPEGVTIKVTGLYQDN